MSCDRRACATGVRACGRALGATSVSAFLCRVLLFVSAIAVPTASAYAYWRWESLRSAWFIAGAGLATAELCVLAAPVVLTSPLQRQPVLEDLRHHPAALRAYRWTSHGMFVLVICIGLEYWYDQYNGSTVALIDTLVVLCSLTATLRTLQIHIFKGILQATVVWFDIRQREKQRVRRSLELAVTHATEKHVAHLVRTGRLGRGRGLEHRRTRPDAETEEVDDPWSTAV